MVVAFETLLLGLVMGSVPVRVMVGPTVASVELRLDDKRVGELHGAPWSLVVDLGGSPHPHELVAVARHASGSELGRARQRINLPRPDAEVTVVLERRRDGRITARLAWDQSQGRAPSKVEATLDGVPLEGLETDRITLPAVDLALPHVLSVQLSFPRGGRARADVAFGADLVENVLSELTAIPVLLAPGVVLPPPPSLQGWFEANGSPLRVVGCERGVAAVVFVFDQHAAGRLRGRWGDYHTFQTFGADLAPDSQDDRFSVVMPKPKGVVGRRNTPRNLFPALGPTVLTAEALAAVSPDLPFDVSHLDSQPLGTAVCLAGLYAAGSGRRRAVVLVLASDGHGDDAVSPDAARAFLSNLRVPFRVWSIEDERNRRVNTAWGDAEDVALRNDLDRAMARLRDDLDAQRIVWVEDVPLPQDVALTPRATGVRLVP